MMILMVIRGKYDDDFDNDTPVSLYCMLLKVFKQGAPNTENNDIRYQL